MLEIRKRRPKTPFVKSLASSSDRKDQFCFKRIRKPPRSSERLTTGAVRKQMTEDREQRIWLLAWASASSTRNLVFRDRMRFLFTMSSYRKTENRRQRTDVLGAIAASSKIAPRAEPCGPRSETRDLQTDVSSEAPVPRRRLIVEQLGCKVENDPSSVVRSPTGGARRDRTDDLMLAKHALSQLSYGPVRRRRTEDRGRIENNLSSVLCFPFSDPGGPGRT